LIIYYAIKPSYCYHHLEVCTKTSITILVHPVKAVIQKMAGPRVGKNYGILFELQSITRYVLK